MLVLSRKEGQSITVGDAEIEVLRCRNGAVRIGIKAPTETRILRSELKLSPTAEGNETRTADGPNAVGIRRAG
jgi:carbon storage regulator CsrA